VTAFTRPATWADVKTLASYLSEESVQFALIGGYALAAHGLVRFSEDIDILVAPDDKNTERWVRALSRLPDAAAEELKGETGLFDGEGPQAIRINDEITVDMMASACGHSWDELKPYVQMLNLEGTKIPVLSIRGLLLTKEGMREKDKADARALRALLERQDLK
jgi:Nucleotidyl transferase AbiEii toxin, Type IV TA system